MKTYPIYLVHLDRQRCVVIGGGRVAARKVAGLRAAGAQVTIISPELCPVLEEQVANDHSIEVNRRDCRPGDLNDAFLAIAATDDTEVNHQIWEAARARNILVNVVDDPDRCTFIAPSVVRRGPLSLAISTSGQSPALSRHLRQQLEQTFGPEYAIYVTLLGEIRKKSLDYVPVDRRRVLWDDLLASDILELILTGDEAAAHQRAEAILSQYAEEGEG